MRSALTRIFPTRVLPTLKTTSNLFYSKILIYKISFEYFSEKQVIVKINRGSCDLYDYAMVFFETIFFPTAAFFMI